MDVVQDWLVLTILHDNEVYLFLQKIGMAYINHLVEKGEYDSAAR